MLLEWFAKRQQPRPKIEIVSEGRRFRATVSVSGGLMYELPDGETFEKRDGAEQAAATMALLQLFPDQPLYRLLPPAYRALWLQCGPCAFAGGCCLGMHGRVAFPAAAAQT